MAFVKDYKVRFGDTDPAGVMYFPRFLDVFHQVFEDWFDEELRVPYRWSIQDRRVGFPAVHTECDYRGPFRFGDIMAVELTLVRLGKTSFTCRYRARLEGEDFVRVQAEVVAVVCDLESFEPVPMPAKLRRELEARLQRPVRGVSAAEG